MKRCYTLSLCIAQHLLLQGFASGDLERDAAAVRLFTDAGLELLLSQVRHNASGWCS